MTPAQAARQETAVQHERARRTRENGPCVLIDPRVIEDPIGRCNWCGEPLPLTSLGNVSLVRRWCSRLVRVTIGGQGYEWTHGAVWSANHSWSTARELAVIRSGGRCDLCAATPEDIEVCQVCRRAWPCPVGARDPDLWLTTPSNAAVHRPGPETRRSSWYSGTVSATQLEVNHVEPRNGAGYDKGCWNHQSNLQVLCHPCHVAETTRQIQERPILAALAAGTVDAREAQRLIDLAALPRHLRPRGVTPGFFRSPEAQAEAEARAARRSERDRRLAAGTPIGWLDSTE